MKYAQPIYRLLTAAGLSLAALGAAVLGGPAASADTPNPIGGATFTAAAPSISPLSVQPFGVKATVTFTTSEPAIVTFDLTGPSAAAPMSQPPSGRPLDGVRAPLAGGATTVDTPSLAAYQTQHEIPLTGLRSNTLYEVSVAATTRSGQRLTAQTTFITLKERIRVTLREIKVIDDGDLIGNGEPLWTLILFEANTGGCFPIDCTVGSYSEGRILPRNSAGQFLSWTLAEENFDTLPETLTLRVGTEEDDWNVVFEAWGWIAYCLGPNSYGCLEDYEYTARWKAPRGVEWSSTPVTVRGDDGEGFKSELIFTFETFHDNLSYPAPGRNIASSTWK